MVFVQFESQFAAEPAKGAETFANADGVSALLALSAAERSRRMRIIRAARRASWCASKRVKNQLRFDALFDNLRIGDRDLMWLERAGLMAISQWCATPEWCANRCAMLRGPIASAKADSTELASPTLYIRYGFCSVQHSDWTCEMARLERAPLARRG